MGCVLSEKWEEGRGNPGSFRRVAQPSSQGKWEGQKGHRDPPKSFKERDVRKEKWIGKKERLLKGNQKKKSVLAWKKGRDGKRWEGPSWQREQNIKTQTMRKEWGMIDLTSTVEALSQTFAQPPLGLAGALHFLSNILTNAHATWMLLSMYLPTLHPPLNYVISLSIPTSLHSSWIM